MDFNLPETFWSLTSAEDLLESLHTSREGLTEEEARQRLDRFGPNTLKVREHAKVLRLLLSQYKSPIILLLLFACLLSLAFHDHVDALIILAILLVSGLLSFWQEYGASQATAKLLAMVQVKATVCRRSSPQEIPVEEIVGGLPLPIPSNTCSWLPAPTSATCSAWPEPPCFCPSCPSCRNRYY